MYPGDFYVRASKVIELASQEARRFNQEYVGTEHLLLAVIKDRTAANVLQKLGVDPRLVRLSVEELIQSAPDPIGIWKLPLTPRSKKVIEAAMNEALDLNHNYFLSEHMLLGMLCEQESVAAQILMNLGVKLHEVREAVRNFGDPPSVRL